MPARQPYLSEIGYTISLNNVILCHNTGDGMSQDDFSKLGTSAATFARLQLGTSTDMRVLEAIRESPGISMYNIAKALQFAPGRVDGSVNRLQNRNEIDTQYTLRDGRIVKELYPKGFVQESKPEVKIDTDLLDSPDDWKEKAFVYALDRMTIGISPFESHEWNPKAFAKEIVDVNKSSDSVLVKIPQRLAEFYVWNNSDSEVSVVGNDVLVTLKTTIPIIPSEMNKPLLVENEMRLQSFRGTRQLLIVVLDANFAAIPAFQSRSKKIEGKYGTFVALAPLSR
jgi:hypothetical protein